MVYSIGEALIDMIPCETGRSLRYVETFSKQAGGAPANTAAAVAKLGGKSSFISKVGMDGFGRFIADTLEGCGVDISKVFYSEKKFTGIIYIAQKEDGDREFCAMRQDSADLYLLADEINPDWFTNKDILHFCSVSLVEAPVKYAHVKAIESIIKSGGRVSFDINMRLMLWERKEDCLFTIWDFMKYPDYLKVSDDEIELILNTTDYDYAARKFFDKGSRLKFIIVSCGKKGSYLYYRDGSKYHINAYESIAVDTTGAGDCFIGSILYHLDKGNCEPTSEELLKIIDFAAAAAAVQVRMKGAIQSLPSFNEVMDLIETKNY